MSVRVAGIIQGFKARAYSRMRVGLRAQQSIAQTSVRPWKKAFVEHDSYVGAVYPCNRI
jgi:hypothetical protein